MQTGGRGAGCSKCAELGPRIQGAECGSLSGRKETTDDQYAPEMRGDSRNGSYKAISSGPPRSYGGEHPWPLSPDDPHKVRERGLTPRYRSSSSRVSETIGPRLHKRQQDTTHETTPSVVRSPSCHSSLARPSAKPTQHPQRSKQNKETRERMQEPGPLRHQRRYRPRTARGAKPRPRRRADT